MARTILIIELLMGATLLLGMFLARAKAFRAHGICQSIVIILNLAPIALFMLPAFRKGILPGLPAQRFIPILRRKTFPHQMGKGQAVFLTDLPE